jgi:hypothetical protein
LHQLRLSLLFTFLKTTETRSMKTEAVRPAAVCIAVALLTLSGCSGGASTPVSPTTPSAASSSTPSTPVVVKPALAAPVAASPLSGATVPARPTFTVTNSARTGTVPGAVSYTFEIADNPNFAPVGIASSQPETANQTSFVLPGDLAAGRVYYWRATAFDASDGLTSPASDVQMIATVNTAAGRIADQQGIALWPGTQPGGTPGQARMGPGWNVGQQTSFNGVTFQSPPIEALRLFDLIDRGYDPDAAIRWMSSNGYPTQAVYYPQVLAIGLPYQYMALVANAWELVHRVGA